MRALLNVPAMVVIAILASCSTTPPPSTPQPPAMRPAAAPATGAPASPAQSRVATINVPPAGGPPSAIPSARSVYFDFDDFTVGRAFVGVVEGHGRYLAAHPALSIKIEGNADERGSREYNLALGQKRARAVLNALRVMGVRDAQMEAVSWGEERPRNPGHDEGAWAENRRADLVYSAR